MENYGFLNKVHIYICVRSTAHQRYLDSNNNPFGAFEHTKEIQDSKLKWNE